MGFLVKLLIRTVANGALLYYLPSFFSDFIFTGDIKNLVFAALVVTFLGVFVKPVLRFVTFPIRLLTLGLFSIVIHVFIMWLADYLLIHLAIESFVTLFIASILFAFVNTIL